MREFISLSGELAERETPAPAESVREPQPLPPRRNLHKFELDGDYFVIDPASGAVHIADKYAFDLLDKSKLVATFEKYEGLEGGCYKELRDLYKAGLLFSEDDCREYAETSIDAPLKALCLHVSHDCNLQCGYCFAEAAVAEHTTMSSETAIAAIERLVAESGERVDLEADFFGGEPLMAWETVTAAVDYARANEARWGKSFRFTITTNGLLLDADKIAYINREMTNCVLSLDGRREVNDKMRPCKNGKGSFDVVLPKFRELLASRTKPGFTDCYIRGTFTAHNLDFAEDVLELARLGFRNISLEPVTCYEDSGYAIRPEHLPQICAEYERLYRLIRSGELDVNFFHFNVDLTGGPCVIRRLRGCGAGNEYLAISPDGGAYPCHRFVGDSRWVMTPEIKEYFTKTHIYTKSDCPDCWARFYCSGGCNATSHECFGDCRKTDSGSVDCVMMKKRLEAAIALNALKTAKT
jgi:uncharacterized protein